VEENFIVVEYLTAALSSRLPASRTRSPGQGLVEYGLIMALCAVVAIAGLLVLGPKLQNTFKALGSSV